MKQCLVVGYGNILRGDDGLGPLIAEKLAEGRGAWGGNVRTVSLPLLDITLAPALWHVDTAIFADARQDADDDPVKVERVDARSAPAAGGHSSHVIGIAALATIVQTLYGRCPDCYLVMPKGFDFSIGAPISRQGRRTAEQAAAAISRIIAAAGVQRRCKDEIENGARQPGCRRGWL
jgi:hydrogenase maturation protease